MEKMFPDSDLFVFFVCRYYLNDLTYEKPDEEVDE